MKDLDSGETPDNSVTFNIQFVGVCDCSNPFVDYLEAITG